MSEIIVEFKADVLGYHPIHGELISASAAKEVIDIFQNRIAKLEKDISFLQSCVNSGETASIADRPSERAKKLKGGEL